MSLADLDRRIAELADMRRRLESVKGVLRPIDDPTLQLLGLIASDAAAYGRIVPEVPTFCDLGETARLFRRRADLKPGDRLTVCPPFAWFQILTAAQYAPILTAWGCRVEVRGDKARGERP